MPEIGEVHELLKRHIETTDLREKDRIQREVLRAESEAQFRGEMKGALGSLQGKQAEHEARFSKLETETEGKFKVFGQRVLVSIEEGDRAVLAKVDGHNQIVVDLLKGQNEVAEAKAKTEQDAARVNESMRARHKVEGFKAKTPVYLGIISLVGLIASNVSTCQATQVAQDKATKNIATLTAKVDAIPQTLSAPSPKVRWDTEIGPPATMAVPTAAAAPAKK